VRVKDGVSYVPRILPLRSCRYSSWQYAKLRKAASQWGSVFIVAVC